MENTNNSSTYDEVTENKTENQTEGFLYSNEQAEIEKPVQQAVSLDKNAEAVVAQNPETSTDPNPNVTLGTNAASELNANMQMNPAENPNMNSNPGVNPNMNLNMNPNLNGGYNPNMNGGYNPNMNPNMMNGFQPNMNQNINGGYNANMNPNMNQNVSGGYNANMNPNLNPNMNGGYNPNMNPNMYQGAQNYNQPKREVADYTSKFDEKDRSENKIFAMLPYLLGIFGIIIALLAAKKSDYVQFHVRQSAKLTVCAALLGIIMIPFSVLSLIPFVGILFGIIVALIAIVELGIVILNIVAFAQVCNGKAKEPAIVGELKMFN